MAEISPSDLKVESLTFFSVAASSSRCALAATPASSRLRENFFTKKFSIAFPSAVERLKTLEKFPAADEEEDQPDDYRASGKSQETGQEWIHH